MSNCWCCYTIFILFSSWLLTIYFSFSSLFFLIFLGSFIITIFDAPHVESVLWNGNRTANRQCVRENHRFSSLSIFLNVCHSWNKPIGQSVNRNNTRVWVCIHWLNYRTGAPHHKTKQKISSSYTQTTIAAATQPIRAKSIKDAEKL